MATDTEETGSEARQQQREVTGTPIEILEDALIETYPLEVCRISGDPGCLGWPSWHDESCRWEEVELQRCLCGADEVWGYGLQHEENCPLHDSKREAYL